MSLTTTDIRQWAVFVKDGEPHVVPVYAGISSEPACGHILSHSCACRPEPLRDGPLSDPVWNHLEPSWPGAEASLCH